MEEAKLFLVDQNSKTMKRISTSRGRMFIIVAIDATILMLVIPFLLFMLSNGGVELNDGAVYDTYYMEVVSFFIAINFIIAIIDFIKFMKINDSVLIKEGDKILLMYKVSTPGSTTIMRRPIGIPIGIRDSYSFDSGVISLERLVSLLADINEAKVRNYDAAAAGIQQLLEDPRLLYEFYTDCKLIRETRKYYLFNGNKVGNDGQVKNKNFRVAKIYQIRKEDIA